jgi:hypothetical protein
VRKRILIILIVMKGFSSESQMKYWEDIYSCEDSISTNLEYSVQQYFKIFKKFGVNQFDNWLNAIKLSERIKSNYSDSLILILSKELDLNEITNPKSKNYYKLYLPSLESKILKYYNIESSVEKRKLSKETLNKWDKLRRKDQIPRMFSFMISNKLLRKIDNRNREKFYQLYEENNFKLPNRLDFGRLNSLEPYWVLFQHSGFNYKDSIEKNNLINMDYILKQELMKGNLSPKYTQYHIIYQILRSVNNGEEYHFEKSDDFISYWFLYKNYQNFIDFKNAISDEKLIFINQVRKRYLMQEIDDNFFNKKMLFENLGLTFVG